MADYEKGLLARVLFKRELQDVIDRRIEPKMLADEKSRKAFEFVLDFYKKYGDVPSIDLVEQEFPELKLEYAKEPVGYYIDKLVEQYVRNRGSYILTENARLLVTNPMNGLEMLRSEFARLTVEANPTRDVNLVETMNDRKKRYLELKNLKGIDGYPTPWQVLNEACVTGDSMIYDVETGKMVRMDDFCKGNFNSVLSFTSDGIREKMVSFKGRVTDKECLKIKTNSGHEIEGTYEHPVLTPSGWKRLDEVEIGENIAVVSRYPEPKNVVKIPDEHVDLIALLLSEGYISDGHVSVSNTDPEIIEVIRKSAEKMGCVVKQYGRSWNIVFGGRPERKHRGKRGRFTKDRIHPVQKMIDEYGIKRVTADKKEIPDVIFRLNNEQLRRFIAVFWSGDGYVNCCNKGRRGENVIVGINLTSKKMIQQLRTLLLRFGIVTHYMEVPQRNERWKMQYRLLVPTEFHEKFLNTFDLLGRRGVVLKERLSRRKFEHRTKLRLSDEIKNNLRRRFEEKKSLGGAGSSGKGVIAKIRKCVDKNFESFEGCFVRRKGERSNVIEKRMLKAMLEVLDVQDYMWVVNDDIHWVEVVSIERTGVKTVYDVTVPGTHCFIANDVVVHNTMGWHPGEFISIVSRPAVGKTFMLVVFAEYAWANGLSVLFINNEMSEEQIGKRFDSVHFKLPYKEFRAGLLPDELEKRYFEGLQELEGENPIWVISDVSGVMSIASKIDQYKPDIVMIDGMYLLNDDQKGDSRWERVTNVSRDLKKLAQQKRVPIIATTQFNRATDETRVERVTLSNIGFSDSLGQDCLPKDTLIWSNRGLVRLDELDDEKDLVFDGETFRRFKLLKEKEKEVYEVRLKHSGQVFRCSGDHGLLAMSKKPELEWKKAKDLSPGDSVVQVESELSGERGALNYVPISKKMRFDEVESVVATGVVEPMYDLNVEESHRFVAEGLMVHNSDIVLGLFRTRDMELNNEMLVRMLKVREGQPVDFSLLWDLRRMEFKVIATQDENQFIDDEEGDEVDF